MYLQYKSNRLCKKSHGFTLIEVLCVLLLLGLLGGYLLGGYVNIARSHIDADESYQQVQKAQIALLRIILEMQNASAVTGNNAVLTYTRDGANKKISTQDGNLVLYTDAATPSSGHILTDNVSSFVADYNSNILSVTMTVANKLWTKDFSTKVYIP